MPKVEREDIGALNATLKVTIEKSDYVKEFNSKLAAYGQKASMKGFRKGKTPKSVIRKMYGKSLLGEILEEKLQKALGDYVESEKLAVVLQPLLAEGEEGLDPNPRELEDYVLTFDVGLFPEFEIKGLDKDTVYEKKVVEVREEEIDEELTALRERNKRQVVVDEPAQEGDIVMVKVAELESGEPKADGLTGEFSLIIGESLTEVAAAALTGSTAGDTLLMNLMELEHDRTEHYVRRYYLSGSRAELAERGEITEAAEQADLSKMYKLTIGEVKRAERPPLDEAFFSAAFGPESGIKTEEEAREKIRESLAKYYDSMSLKLLYHDMEEQLLALNAIALPEAFIKRWLKFNYKTETDEKVEELYEDLAKQVRWMELQRRLIDQFDLAIEQQDVIDAAFNRILGYFGGNVSEAMMPYLQPMVEKMLKEEDSVRELADIAQKNKVVTALPDKVTLQENQVSIEELKEAYDAIQPEGQVPALEEEE